jgi:hypothetical protein
MSYSLWPIYILQMTFEIWTFQNYILKFKKFQISQFFNYDFFLKMDSWLSPFQKKSHQISLMKRVLNLELYKIDVLVLIKFKSPLLKKNSIY